MHSGAIDYLLRRRLEKVDRSLDRWRTAGWLGLGTLLVGVSLSENWTTGLVVLLLTACYMCIGLYFYRSWHCAAVLSDLRQRGALEELVATPLSSWEIVDSITWHTVRQGLRLLALPFLVLFGSLAVLREWPMLAAVAALLPVYLSMTGYGLQAWNAWSLKGRYSWVGMALGCLFIYFPAIPIGGAVFWLGERSPEAGLGLVALWCLALLLTLRWLGVLGLERGQALEDGLRSEPLFESCGRRTVVPAALWQRNPVLARCLQQLLRPGLCQSAAAALGFGLACFYGATFAIMLYLDPTTLLPVLLLVSLGGGSSAAWMAVNQVKGEQATGGYELAKTSGLSATTCADGWAAAGWLRPMLALFVLLPFIVYGATVGDCPTSLLVLGLVWSVVTILSGAYAGVASRLSGDLTDSRISTKLLLLSLVELLLLLGLMMLWLPHPWLSQGLLLVWSGGSLLFYRWRSITWLQTPAGETRFCRA